MNERTNNAVSRVAFATENEHYLFQHFGRFVQEVLKDCPQSVFIRIVKWIEDNMEDVIEIKPSVFVALGVIDQIVTSCNEDESWSILLESLIRSLLKINKVSFRFVHCISIFMIISGFL